MDSLGRDPILPMVDGFADDGDGRGSSSRARDSLFLMARILFAGDRAPVDVRVRNLSSGGLMAEIDRLVAEGTVVGMEMRGVGEIQGKVAWCTEGRIGISFDSPIDPKKARKPVGKGATTPDYAKPFGR